ncbi:MAG: alanine racemase [bacterium]|nr:alanine racemase [bacterium]
MKNINLQNYEVRTWLEIDTKKLRHNYLEFRRLIGKKCLLLAVVKSNAYGHGLVGYSEALDKIGVDWFGVDSFVEARKLRDAGIKKPILVLGYTLPSNFDDAAKLNVSLTVSSIEQVKTLTQILRLPLTAQDDNEKKVKIHLKIDTGMHRQGIQLDELPEALKVLKSMKNIVVEGIYSHFADVVPPKYLNAKIQLEKFEKANQIIESACNPKSHLRGVIGGLIRHITATAGAIGMPESHFDMVRIGIGLMGLWPSDETRKAVEDYIRLEPILSWKTVVSEIKSVKKYESVGYGFTAKLKRDSKLAILPIGYWHGFRRALSSKGEVLIRGVRCKVLGRVSMDMTTVDVTDLKSVDADDTVTLIGKDEDEEIAVEEMAELADSYTYEIITTINPLIKKVYL